MPTMATPLRDPTAEFTPLLRERQTPPESLDGKTIALLDIGKARSREFLDRLEQQFHGQGLLTRRYAKPTNTKMHPWRLFSRLRPRPTSSSRRYRIEAPARRAVCTTSLSWTGADSPVP